MLTRYFKITAAACTSSVRASPGPILVTTGTAAFSFPGICLKRPANDFMLDRAPLLTIHIWSKLH